MDHPQPYRNPGSRHFVGLVAGDDVAPDAARLRNAAGSLRPLATIDTLLGQAERQDDRIAEKTYAEAAKELAVLRVAAEAGHRALSAFAEARGFEAPGGAGDPGSHADAARQAEALRAENDRLAARVAELDAELDDLTRPGPGSLANTPDGPPILP